MSWDNSLIDALRECPPSSWRWAAIGYKAGWHDCGSELSRDLGSAGHAAAKLARPVLRQPRWDEIRRQRVDDHEPCLQRCDRCSRCTHAAAWAARGGRDYLGVEAEARLAAGVPDGTPAGAAA